MNGTSGDKICHARGLRQGDPLSPMLFLLVLEVFETLIRKADAWSLLHPCRARIPHYAYFYINDLVLFISLNPKDLHMACITLSVSEDSLGLGCNLAKCQMAPIRCTEDQVCL
jgi:hypothetical protein